MASSNTEEESHHVEVGSQERSEEMDGLIKITKELGVTITPLIVLGGYLNNTTKCPLTLIASDPWAGYGYTVKDYPNPLDNLYTIYNNVFEQVCVTYDGIMSAVVYAGDNSAGVECRWLLAWGDSNDKKKKRVYAECGKKSKFNCIDWEEIKGKLNSPCTKESADVKDSETGTSVYAVLGRVDFPLETQDTLSVIFGG